MEFREEALINPEVIDLTEFSIADVADVSLKVNVNALSDVLELLSTDIAAKLAAVVCATVAVIDVALTVLSCEASVWVIFPVIVMLLEALYPAKEVGSAIKAETWTALIVIDNVCSQLLITSDEKDFFSLVSILKNQQKRRD